MSFRVTLTDLQRLSKVFDDAKHRAASLRQLNFLFHTPPAFDAAVLAVKKEPIGKLESWAYQKVTDVWGWLRLAVSAKTDSQLATARQHTPRLCIASRAKKSNSFSACVHYSWTHNNLLQCFVHRLNAAIAHSPSFPLFVLPFAETRCRTEVT